LTGPMMGQLDVNFGKFIHLRITCKRYSSV
jgi:hypothetical protein